MKRYFFFIILCLFITNNTAHAWQKEFIKALKNGGAFVETESGEILLNYRSQDHFMPASTLKIATSACALDKLGPGFRFATDFYVTPQHQLIIKGFGDPNLISEEVSNIAKTLASKGLHDVSSILIDSSYFAPDIVIDGSSNTTNPYDAVNGAVIVNYNTINIQKSDSGVFSAETQTPITAIAREEADRLPKGRQRVNLGKDTGKSIRYAGELFAAFLKREGVNVHGPIQSGKAPEDAKIFYHHTSSKTLQETIQELLKYSTNFMANQIFLTLGAEQFGAPATIEKGRRVLKDYLTTKVGWKNFEIKEGAGLSRQDSVTPRQMVQLLHSFESHWLLLPEEEKYFHAKTGTLTGANSLAGFFIRNNGQRIRFALLVNDNVPFDYKFRLARMLYKAINGGDR